MTLLDSSVKFAGHLRIFSNDKRNGNVYNSNMDFDRIDSETEEKEQHRERHGCAWPIVKVFLFFFFPFLILMGLLPALFSSSAGNKWIENWINERISPAQVSYSSLSVGWFSSLRLQDFWFEDPREGVTVLSKEVIADAGLMGAFPVGRMRLGKVKVWNPFLKVGPPKFTSRPEGKGLFLPVLDFSGSCELENGTAIWTGGDGSAPVEIKGIHAEFDHPSFWTPFTVLVSAKVGKGTFSVSGTLKSLADFSSGSQSSETSRSLSLTADQVDLAALRPFTELIFSHSFNCKGMMSGLASVEIDGPRALSGKSSLKIEHFSIQTPGKARPPEGRVDVTADFRMDGEEIRFAPLSISSPWGKLRAEGALDKHGERAGYTGSLQSTVQIDLVPFARDFGTSIDLPRELQVRSGVVKANGTLTAGDELCQLDLLAEGSQIVLSTGGVPSSLTPNPKIHLQMDIPYDPQMKPVVRLFEMGLPFADMKGDGKLDSFNLFGTIDFTALSKKMGQLYPQLPVVTGRISFEAGSEPGGKRVMLGALISGKSFSITPMSGDRIVLPDWRAAVKGHVPYQGKKNESWRIDDGMYEVKIGKGELTGSWTRMSWNERKILTLMRGMKIQAHFSPEELALLLGNSISAEKRRQLRAGRGEWIANGSAEVASGEMKSLWNMAVVNWKLPGADGGNWSVPDFRLKGSLEQGGRSGDSLRGNFTFSGAANFVRDGLTLFQEEGAKGLCKAEWNAEKGDLEISRLSYSGSLGELDLEGSVKELQGPALADIKGVWAPDLKTITSLLYAYGIQGISYRGRKLRKVSIQAPLGLGWETFLEKGKMSGAVCIETLKGMGLLANPSDLSVDLHKGQLHASYLPKVNGGQIDLRPVLFLQNKKQIIQLPKKTRVCDQVTITQELIEHFLINMNPFLRESKIRKGFLTLDVAYFNINLDLPQERCLDCAFMLALNDVELMVGPELQSLLHLLRIKDPIYRAKEIRFPVQIRDGTVSLGRTEIPLGKKQNLVCYGKIAADGQLAYTVEVPVTEDLFGPVISGLLGGATFKIPVTGTMDHPYVDTAALTKAMSSSFVKQPSPKKGAGAVSSSQKASRSGKKKGQEPKRQFSPERFFRDLRNELEKSIPK